MPSLEGTTPEGSSLGNQVEVFRPSPANPIAGFIISVLLIVGGLAAIGFPLRGAYQANWDLPFNVKTGWSWFAVVLFWLIGIVVLIGGVVLAKYSRWLMSQRVEVSPEGFRRCSGDSAESIGWTDVVAVRETILYERPPVLKGPAKLLLPKVASTSYAVITASGQEYGFDGNTVGEIKRFGQLLRAQSERHSLTWEVVEQHT